MAGKNKRQDETPAHDPNTNTPEALAALARMDERQALEIAVRDEYDEADINQLTLYGYDLADVPLLVQTRRAWSNLISAGNLGMIEIGAQLARIRDSPSRQGKWGAYLDYAGIPVQAAERMIGAAEAATTYPALASGPVAEALDTGALYQIGQSRRALTDEAVDQIVNRAEATGKLGVAQVKEIIQEWGDVNKLSPKAKARKDPVLGFRRADPEWARLNAESFMAGVAGWGQEALDFGVQPGLVRLSSGYREWVRGITSTTTSPPTEFEFILGEFFTVLYFWWESAKGVLTPHTLTRVEAGTYDLGDPITTALIAADGDTAGPVDADPPDDADTFRTLAICAGCAETKFVDDYGYCLDCYEAAAGADTSIVDGQFVEAGPGTLDLTDEQGQGYDANELPRSAE